MMADVKAEVAEALQNGTGINLFFALKQGNDEIKIKRADLADGDTQKHLMQQFVDLLWEDFLQEDALQILELSAADERKDTLYHYDMTEFPESLRYFMDFDYQEEYETFSFQEDDLICIDAYLIVIGNQEHHCILYKKFYSVFLLGRGSFCLLPANKRFEEFDKEVLRISKDYQFIRIGGDVFIKDVKVLEKFGGFREVIIREASAAIDAIDQLGILEESEGLRELVEDDVTFARKLYKIKKMSPVLELNIDNKAIIEFSRTHPGLVNQFRYNENQDRILLTTKKSKNVFLKLLDDCFLKSDLTNCDYDSLAKNRCEKGEGIR